MVREVREGYSIQKMLIANYNQRLVNLLLRIDIIEHSSVLHYMAGSGTRNQIFMGPVMNEYTNLLRQYIDFDTLIESITFESVKNVEARITTVEARMGNNTI